MAGASCSRRVGKLGKSELKCCERRRAWTKLLYVTLNHVTGLICVSKHTHFGSAGARKVNREKELYSHFFVVLWHERYLILPQSLCHG